MRRRWRTIILVTGTTLCVLIGVAFVASAFWSLAFDIPGPMLVAAFAGSLIMGSDEASTVGFGYAERHPWGLAMWNTWWPSGYIHLPLYAVFLAIAIPTLLVWRFGRKPPKPGHCAFCGYNLTGNVSGRCPECGQAATGGSAQQNPPNLVCDWAG